MRDFLDVTQSRKSVRTFSSKKVPHALIEKIIKVGAQAPTSCNQQLWHVVVIEDEKTKSRLIKEAASNTLLNRVPVALVVTYDGWNYKESIQGSSLMVGHILLAAEYYGLGALPVNSYGSDAQIKNILNIPNSQTICCFVLLGYKDKSAELAKPVERRPISEVLHYKTYSQDIAPTPYAYDPEQWQLRHIRDHQKYFSRKTVGGKEMDIMSDLERQVVSQALHRLHGHVADLFSYDGSFLREFPHELQDITIHTFDLSSETKEYSAQAAANLASNITSTFKHHLYAEEKESLSPKVFDAATIIFKLERISRKSRVKLFKQIHASVKPNGELIITSRTRHPLLMLFFWLLEKMFGPDVRKTGIFAFFGPYRPVSVHQVVSDLQNSGFSSIETKHYFPFPAIFERYVQLLMQYIASGGSSYLHRTERSNVFTRLINNVLAIQEQRPYAWGSVAVIKCRKLDSTR